MALPTCIKCGHTILSETRKNSSYGEYAVVYCMKCGTIHGVFKAD